MSTQDLRARLSAYVRSLNFMGAVLVVGDGEALLMQGFGAANLEHGVANTPRTHLRIGSLTKQFTAMAILILQDQGRLRVGDPVRRHLPSAPAAWQDLTLHQLLTHTSGILHSFALPGFEEIFRIPKTLDETLAHFQDQPLLFTPGESFKYSGVGYFLLAKLIEVISGQDYEAFLKEAIFAPLGMENTGADRPEILLSRRASGYVEEENGEIHNVAAFYIPTLTGGGNLYSTLEDMARWDRALTARAILSSDAYEAMYRPEREEHAYGWVVGPWEGRPTLRHEGSVPGFNAFILRLPEDRLSVVALSNKVPRQAREVAEGLARLVLDEK
jgi:CubicO group peptidase (beta-lactamase class C family)